MITIRIPIRDFIDDFGGVMRKMEAAGIPVVRNGLTKHYMDYKTDECVIEYVPQEEVYKDPEPQKP